MEQQSGVGHGTGDATTVAAPGAQHYETMDEPSCMIVSKVEGYVTPSQQSTENDLAGTAAYAVLTDAPTDAAEHYASTLTIAGEGDSGGDNLAVSATHNTTSC